LHSNWKIRPGRRRRYFCSPSGAFDLYQTVPKALPRSVKFVAREVWRVAAGHEEDEDGQAVPGIRHHMATWHIVRDFAHGYTPVIVQQMGATFCPLVVGGMFIYLSIGGDWMRSKAVGFIFEGGEATMPISIARRSSSSLQSNLGSGWHASGEQKHGKSVGSGSRQNGNNEGEGL
jgi:hypothetical protein